MPFISDRKLLLSNLERLAKRMIRNDEENSCEFNEIMDIYRHLLASRYLNPISRIPKSRSMLDIFWHYPENQFRQIVRMNKRSFLRLLEILSAHPIFSNTTQNPKKPTAAWIQLMIALQRFGCFGNGASVDGYGRLFGSCNAS